MKNNKYPNGYMPKIQHYSNMIAGAAKQLEDTDSLSVTSRINMLLVIQEAAASLEYFISKEHMRLNLKK